MKGTEGGMNKEKELREGKEIRQILFVDLGESQSGWMHRR